MGKNSDVLVIGVGIIGLACADYLAKAGKNVRLLEQDRVNAETAASYGNGWLKSLPGANPILTRLRSAFSDFF
ncbi:MAG: FAD-binding oxidoreductase [Deltaproteobacteria bacterium]|jgi:D-amino-acid dehydrogenase|nr:FAD-binding oxidoreductase [Deltaproteobacteria bacterium]